MQTLPPIKKAVKKAGTSVKKEIQQNAPSDTGDYAKSWAVKNTKETSNSLEVTVHSKNRYQLAHLLEHGHAKRGGGRGRKSTHRTGRGECSPSAGGRNRKEPAE